MSQTETCLRQVKKNYQVHMLTVCCQKFYFIKKLIILNFSTKTIIKIMIYSFPRKTI